MKIIAHRALLDGPDSELENNPEQIKKAIHEGFDIEIDIRYENDNYYLGHDCGKYKVTIEDLYHWSNFCQIYLHCKNICTLQNYLNMLHSSRIIPFFHEEDPCILLSNNRVWVHPRNVNSVDISVKNAIIVLPDCKNVKPYNFAYGICTDYAKLAKSSIKR